MPKFVIERPLPGAGGFSAEDLQAIAQKSNEVLDGMAGRAQWLQSFVTGDKIYCVYIASDEQVIREHAKAGGFPVTRISEVKAVIDPATAEPSLQQTKA